MGSTRQSKLDRGEYLEGLPTTHFVDSNASCHNPPSMIRSPYPKFWTASCDIVWSSLHGILWYKELRGSFWRSAHASKQPTPSRVICESKGGYYLCSWRCNVSLRPSISPIDAWNSVVVYPTHRVYRHGQSLFYPLCLSICILFNDGVLLVVWNICPESIHMICFFSYAADRKYTSRAPFFHFMYTQSYFPLFEILGYACISGTSVP